MEETDAQSRNIEKVRAAVDPYEPGAGLQAAAQAQADEELAVQQAAKASPPMVIFKAATQDEGEIVRGMLESEGIPAVLVDHSSPPLGDALIATETHWGDILVAPSDADRAMELIESSLNTPITDEMVYGTSAAEDTDV